MSDAKPAANENPGGIPAAPEAPGVPETPGDAQELAQLAGLADVMEFALAGRPERVEDIMMALAPAEVRAAARDTREAFAALALGESPVEPPAALRERLLASVVAYAPRRALVVIDMINDHLTPGALLEVPRARAIVPALRKRLDEARAAGTPVVYVIDEHEVEDSDLDAWGTHAVKGTSGAEVWRELTPHEGDRIVKKPSYSAFFGSELQAVLDELVVDTLTLTGCLTEIGIMATATDAMQRGFAIEVPPDAQAGIAAEVEMVALGTMRAMVPYGPARKARLDSAKRHAA